MKPVIPCTMCLQDNECTCRNAFVSFLSLCKKASARILTLKPSSRAPHGLAGVGIDKLNASFQQLPLISEILCAAKSNSFEVLQKRLEGRNTLRIGDEKLFIHIHIDPSRTMATGFISNPNRFKSWGDYMHFIELVLPKMTLETAKVNRLDLNIDFTLPFDKLIQQIDLKGKTTTKQYEDKAGEGTGIYIGKGPEVLVIYDKAKKDRTSGPHTRIELRLRGSKLPTHNLYDLPKQLENKAYFSQVEGVELDFNFDLLTDIQKQRLRNFQLILKREGLFAARKALSKNRNFERDIARLVKSTPWPNHPSEIFKDGILGFLRRNRDDEHSLH